MVVLSYAVGFIYISRESSVLFLLLQCRLMICGDNGVHYDPIVVLRCFHITVPHYHHYADVSEGTELPKYLSGTFCRVMKSILSVIFRAACILLIHFSYDVRIRVSYHHHQMESMPYLPLFRVRSWYNDHCHSLDNITSVGQHALLWHPFI